jgi:hypothetical protein
MAISKDDFTKKMGDLFKLYEIRYKEYSDKLNFIVNGDDWSFIIKLVAIIESTLTRLLLEKSGDIKFINLFESISLSRKIDLLFELRQYSLKKKTFIKNIKKKRNKLAHDSNELDFKFKIFIKELDNNQRNELLHAINISKDNKYNDSYRKLVFNDTKIAIWVNILPLLLVFDFTRETLKMEKELEEISAVKTEEILKKFKPELFINTNKETF